MQTSDRANIEQFQFKSVQTKLSPESPSVFSDCNEFDQPSDRTELRDTVLAKLSQDSTLTHETSSCSLEGEEADVKGKHNIDMLSSLNENRQQREGKKFAKNLKNQVEPAPRVKSSKETLFSSPESSTASAQKQGVALLDLRQFKTERCFKEGRHNQKKCMFYHEKDQRRPLGSYSSEMCKYAETSQCPEGDACSKAHNRVESFYHPEKYKSKFCKKWPFAVDSCDFGNLCAFAHNEDELSIDLLHHMEHDNDFYMFHFKTVWCPFNDKVKTHQRDECEYAHNWQDFRRKPHVFEYSAKEQCRFWNQKEETKTYTDGCDLEYRCMDCHGWKEKEYHPMHFKVNECESMADCKKKHCPYYHSEAEMRRPPKDLRLYPRNRGTSLGIAHQYAAEYLRVMFSEIQKIKKITRHRKSNSEFFPVQEVYGCGPQSTPVIDPQLVLAFQRQVLAHSHSRIFEKTIGSDLNHKQPKIRAGSPRKDQVSPSTCVSLHFQSCSAFAAQNMQVLPLQSPLFVGPMQTYAQQTHFNSLPNAYQENISNFQNPSSESSHCYRQNSQVSQNCQQWRQDAGLSASCGMNQTPWPQQSCNMPRWNLEGNKQAVQAAEKSSFKVSSQFMLTSSNLQTQHCGTAAKADELTNQWSNFVDSDESLRLQMSSHQMREKIASERNRCERTSVAEFNFSQTNQRQKRQSQMDMNRKNQKPQFYAKQYTSMPTLLHQQQPRENQGSEDCFSNGDRNCRKVWGNSVLSANYDTPIDSQDEFDILYVAQRNELLQFLMRHNLKVFQNFVERLLEQNMTLQRLKCCPEEKIRAWFAYETSTEVREKDITSILTALKSESIPQQNKRD